MGLLTDNELHHFHNELQQDLANIHIEFEEALQHWEDVNEKNAQKRLGADEIKARRVAKMERLDQRAKAICSLNKSRRSLNVGAEKEVEPAAAVGETKNTERPDSAPDGQGLEMVGVAIEGGASGTGAESAL